MSTKQASLYAAAKEVLDKSLPLLDGLHPSNPDANLEQVAAMKTAVENHLSDLVNEIGFVGGPRTASVNQYFSLLLINTETGAFPPPVTLIADPEKIGGTLGKLRDVLGFNFSNRDFVNSIGDEQNLSNFRIISGYVTSLAQSWINNLALFEPEAAQSPAMLLSRQFLVVAKSVNDLRFALDSVFVGQSERQTTRVPLPERLSLESLSLEGLLSWISNFVTNEGPRLLQDAGPIAIAVSIVPLLRRFLTAISHLPKSFSPSSSLPQAFFAPRVTVALARLEDELKSMLRLSESVGA